MSQETGPFNFVTGPLKALKRRRHRRRWRWLRKFKSIYLAYMTAPVVLAVVILGVLAIDSFSKIERSQRGLNAAFNSLTAKPATELNLQDYEQVDGALVALNGTLTRANTRTRPLRIVSFLSADNEARFKLLDAAIHAIAGSRHFLAGLKPTVVLLERGDSDSANTPRIVATGALGNRSVELLRAGKSRFLQAETEFDAANNLIAGIELGGVSPDILLAVDTFLSYVENIETYNDLALVSPDLLSLALGLRETQTYLVLAQNSDEIRPSGGYISTWGWLRVRSGRVQEYDYFPTTADSPHPPPASLALLLDIPDWWFKFNNPIYTAWDGSWYADFPATAEMASWFYDNGDNPFAPVNGVIGVDLIAVENLVSALGEVYVEEYDVIIDAQIFRAMIYEIRASRDVPLAHKHFVAAVYKSVIEAWQNADSQTRGAVNRAFLQALREKHLALYFTDERLQQAIVDLNWGGVQAPAGDIDYILVADANIGSKSSGSVLRELTYDAVIESDGTVNSRLSVLYDFSSAIAELDPAVRPEHYGNNRDYFSRVQVFVPPESQLVSALGLIDDIVTVSGADHAIFTGTVYVPFDESTRVQFEYSGLGVLGEIGAYRRYRLLLQKQLGSRADITTVTVSLPPASKIIATEPRPNAVYDLGRPVLEFNLMLLTDQQVEIIYLD